jgi:hypothetical protein
VITYCRLILASSNTYNQENLSFRAAPWIKLTDRSPGYKYMQKVACASLSTELTRWVSGLSHHASSIHGVHTAPAVWPRGRNSVLRSHKQVASNSVRPGKFLPRVGWRRGLCTAAEPIILRAAKSSILYYCTVETNILFYCNSRTVTYKFQALLEITQTKEKVSRDFRPLLFSSINCS